MYKNFLSTASKAKNLLLFLLLFSSELLQCTHQDTKHTAIPTVKETIILLVFQAMSIIY